MAKLFAHIRLIAGALALAFIVAIGDAGFGAAAEYGQSDRGRGQGTAASQRAQQDPGPRHNSGREVLRAWSSRPDANGVTSMK